MYAQVHACAAACALLAVMMTTPVIAVLPHAACVDCQKPSHIKPCSCCRCAKRRKLSRKQMWRISARGDGFCIATAAGSSRAHPFRRAAPAETAEASGAPPTGVTASPPYELRSASADVVHRVRKVGCACGMMGADSLVNDGLWEHRRLFLSLKTGTLHIYKFVNVQ